MLKYAGKSFELCCLLFSATPMPSVYSEPSQQYLFSRTHGAYRLEGHRHAIIGICTMQPSRVLLAISSHIFQYHRSAFVYIMCAKNKYLRKCYYTICHRKFKQLIHIIVATWALCYCVYGSRNSVHLGGMIWGG